MLPPEVGHLKKLRNLALNENNITELPGMEVSVYTVCLLCVYQADSEANLHVAHAYMYMYTVRAYRVWVFTVYSVCTGMLIVIYTVCVCVVML